MKHARLDYHRIQDPHCKIPYDEPVFLLRGQDRIAWVAVVAWAVVNFVTGGDRKLSRLSFQHAWRMFRWSKHKAANL